MLINLMYRHFQFSCWILVISSIYSLTVNSTNDQLGVLNYNHELGFHSQRHPNYLKSRCLFGLDSNILVITSKSIPTEYDVSSRNDEVIRKKNHFEDVIASFHLIIRRLILILHSLFTFEILRNSNAINRIDNDSVDLNNSMKCFGNDTNHTLVRPFINTSQSKVDFDCKVDEIPLDNSDFTTDKWLRISVRKATILPISFTNFANCFFEDGAPHDMKRYY